LYNYQSLEKKTYWQEPLGVKDNLVFQAIQASTSKNDLWDSFSNAIFKINSKDKV